LTRTNSLHPTHLRAAYACCPKIPHAIEILAIENYADRTSAPFNPIHLENSIRDPFPRPDAIAKHPLLVAIAVSPTA
jgi:hypothetical protein